MLPLFSWSSHFFCNLQVLPSKLHGFLITSVSISLTSGFERYFSLFFITIFLFSYILNEYVFQYLSYEYTELELVNIGKRCHKHAEENNIFNKWSYGKLISTTRSMQLDAYVSPFSKSNYQCTKDINLQHETLNLIEENLGSTIHERNLGKDSLNKTPLAQKLKLQKEEALHKTSKLCKA